MFGGSSPKVSNDKYEIDDLFVLDPDLPSLKTLAVMKVYENNIPIDDLPKTLVTEVRNMTVSNTIINHQRNLISFDVDKRDYLRLEWLCLECCIWWDFM